MTKQYIIKCLLAGMFIVSAGSAVAGPEPDSLQRTAPGAMFGVSAASNTAAISSVSGSDLYHTPAVNMSNSLVGRLPGMTLEQGQGTPGVDNAAWLIRGIGSHGNSGNYNTAKIFVDGFEVNASYFTSLSPSEIESVSILKDGAALTLFGDRGADGVLWVETKRGKQGPIEVSANVRGGFQMPSVINKPLGSYDYAYLYNIAASNDAGRWAPVYNNTQLESYRNGTGVNVDWFDQVMKNSGQYFDADVSMGGGNEWARYYVVLGYLNQQGLFNVKNDRDRTHNVDFQRFNLRANLDINVGKNIEARIDIGGKLIDGNNPSDGVNSIMNSLYTYPNNIYDVWDNPEKTRWSGTAIYPNNPVAALNAKGYSHTKRRVVSANFSLKEKLDFITPGLYLYEAFSINTITNSGQSRTANYMRWHNGENTTTDKDEPAMAGGYGSNGMEDWKQGQISAGYNRTWGKHSLSAAAGVHISAFKGDGYFSYKLNYLNYRGKVHYDYDGRYAAEVSLSSFGNDAYAPEQRWKVYPAVSGAWILSGEDFLKNSSVVDLLKIRASFGMSGAGESAATANISSISDSNGRYLFKEYYTTAELPFGGFYTGAETPGRQTSRIPMFYPNRDAHAETSYKYNLGVDLTMLDNRFNMTADFFMDRRTDILTWDRNIMSYYGWNDAMLNIGKMVNRGFELAAGWSERRGDWSYALDGMVSFSRNKVIEMGEVPTTHNYNAATGRSYGVIIGLEADGFYQESDFENGVLRDGLAVPMFGLVRPGDLKYRDLDGNGFVNDDDVTQIGKHIYPEWTYALRANVGWKGFDLDVLMQGVAGASASLLEREFESGVPFVDNRTIYKMADNSWYYFPEQGLDNRADATYPRLSLNGNQHNQRESSFWVKKLNYLKVRHIELGYTFRVNGLNNFRVYVNAANPFAFSALMRDYDIDPENIGNYYPNLRSFTLGAALSF